MLTATRFFVSVTLLATASFAACQTISDIGGLKLTEGEISATKACKIATKAAERLGLGKFVVDKFTANLQTISGEYSPKGKQCRKWYLQYLSCGKGVCFEVDVFSEELLGFEDYNLVWLNIDAPAAQLGGFAATRVSLRSIMAKHLRNLNIQPPGFMFLSLEYDHEGRIASDTKKLPEATFTIAYRHYSLSLDRATGKLARFKVLRYSPAIETVPDSLVNRVDYAKALETAIAFVRKLGYADVSKDQLDGSLSVQSGTYPSYWEFQHNLFTVDVRADTNEVLEFHNTSIQERYKRGDKVVSKDIEELKRIVANTGQMAGIDPRATLSAAIVPVYGKGGTEAASILEGTYHVNNRQIARLVFDLYQGELLSIKLYPNMLGTQACTIR